MSNKLDGWLILLDITNRESREGGKGKGREGKGREGKGRKKMELASGNTLPETWNAARLPMVSI